MSYAKAVENQVAFNSGFFTGGERPISQHEPLLASERAIAYLLSQRLDERASLDGRRVGIQSSLALSASGEGAIALYDLLDGVVAGASLDERVREHWRKIAAKIEQKLGFPLEPELFSNMLFVACTANVAHPYLKRLSQNLLTTFRKTDARGLYHFFTSLRFACDIDCTGVAARARLTAGDIDLETPQGRAELRQITDRILRSAAVCDVPAEDNESHGKDNGALTRHVFKVYLDDHEVQGAEYDRGLKNNPVVVANALFPVLLELASGARSESEVIPLREFVGGSDVPRTGQASVAEIVVANLRYLRRHLASGAYRRGCRYYGSPDAFLCFYSELIAQFGPMTSILGSPQRLVEAIEERRAASGEGIHDPMSSLNTALRAIAASNVGIDRSPELRVLLDRQLEDGSFPDFGPLYSLGTSSTASVYFGSQALTLAFALRAFLPPTTPVSRTLRRDPTWTRRLRQMALDTQAPL
ncbi:MAG: hypothetical protein ACOY0T_36780 [Myxococcota bacterium]